MKRGLASILCCVWLALTSTLAGAITLYATDGHALYTIDTGAMSYSPIGNYHADPIGGLCFNYAGVMYGISAGDGPALYVIDPATAVATLVGLLNVGFVYEGGLAIDPGTFVLYAVNEDKAQAPTLMTIDQTTGQATAVGQIAGGDHDFAGIAFDHLGQLYGVDRLTNALWKIDKIDPASPGTVQVGQPFGDGIVMGTVGGMTNDYDAEVYYCFAGGSRHLFTVDLATGFPTVLHQFGGSDPLFRSLANPGEFPTRTRSETWGALKARYR